MKTYEKKLFKMRRERRKEKRKKIEVKKNWIFLFVCCVVAKKILFKESYQMNWCCISN
jgi:hypothetical protein